MHFQLDGHTVGARSIRALNRAAEQGPISVSCRGTTFRDAVHLEGVTISSLEADGAIFERGLFLVGSTVTGETAMDRVRSPRLEMRRCRFRRTFFARGAQIGSLVLHEARCDQYVSLDESRIRDFSFRNVRFDEELRLRDVRAEAASAVLKRVRCRRVISLQRSRWGELRLTACVIDGPLHLDSARVNGRLDMRGTRFAGTRRLSVESGGLLDLGQTTFEHPLQLNVVAPRVSATFAVFEQGVNLVLAAEGSELVLSGASLNGLSVVSTDPGADAPGLLSSLRGTRLESLTLRGLDLRGCSFGEAHALEDVVISGGDQLALAPRPFSWSARREVIVDEVDFRHRAELARRPWGPARWHREGGSQTPDRRPEAIAETYRALRHGRERSSDAPGAADFYYGEMEMRRRGTSGLGERLILTTYWLLSGYGLRASRAMLAYLLSVLALTLGLMACGLKSDAPFAEVLVYVLASTTVLARPPNDLDLSTEGAYLQVIARVVGPALFALSLLALRSRVRR